MGAMMQFPSIRDFLRPLFVLIFLSSCAQLPKVELASYLNAYNEVQEITNGVLDIVAPYERIGIKVLAAGPNARSKCTDGNLVDQYCYDLRDGYADIGDPPLVGAYRRLSSVVGRFNAILAAYIDGISMKLITQDLNLLSSELGELSKFGGLESVALHSAIVSFAKDIIPAGTVVGGIHDRAQLKRFLLENHTDVAKALRLMADNSSALYSNVVSGTTSFQRQSGANRAALTTRKLEIRKLIANWTVALDDAVVQLKVLVASIQNPDGLEPRIRNLNETAITSRINTEIIRKQIATLGTPSPGL